MIVIAAYGLVLFLPHGCVDRELGPALWETESQLAAAGRSCSFKALSPLSQAQTAAEHGHQTHSSVSRSCLYYVYILLFMENATPALVIDDWYLVSVQYSRRFCVCVCVCVCVESPCCVCMLCLVG